jgi:hypothetical protein
MNRRAAFPAKPEIRRCERIRGCYIHCYPPFFGCEVLKHFNSLYSIRSIKEYKLVFGKSKQSEFLYRNPTSAIVTASVCPFFPEIAENFFFLLL